MVVHLQAKDNPNVVISFPALQLTELETKAQAGKTSSLNEGQTRPGGRRATGFAPLTVKSVLAAPESLVQELCDGGMWEFSIG